MSFETGCLDVVLLRVCSIFIRNMYDEVLVFIWVGGEPEIDILKRSGKMILYCIYIYLFSW